MPETTKQNNKAITEPIKKVIELGTDKGIIAPFFTTTSITLFKSENKSQFILLEDQKSKQPDNFLINTNLLVTFYSNF